MVMVSVLLRTGGTRLVSEQGVKFGPCPCLLNYTVDQCFLNYGSGPKKSRECMRRVTEQVCSAMLVCVFDGFLKGTTFLFWVLRLKSILILKSIITRAGE